MNIFELPDDDNISDKINLDELYEKKREYDKSKLVVYNKLLSRVHTKIKTTSRQSINERCCWYIIPEMMIGITRYNVQECTSFLLSKLSDNGFTVKYTHPNLLFICWNHWIPDYVRKEMKKQTGVEIDGYGNEIQKNKGGTMSNGKKASFSMTSYYNNNIDSNHKSKQNNLVGGRINNAYSSDSYPPAPTHNTNPSLSNLTLTTPAQVQYSYMNNANPIVNHSPFDKSSPADLKYDPNNHQISYEPYKMTYMSSTSNKRSEDNVTKSSNNNSSLTDMQMNLPLPQQQEPTVLTSSKREPPEYKSVRTYKPSGIYNAEMFSQLKNKLK